MIDINTQVKSRERVAAYGEVFTRDEEVKNMCNLVKEECERFDSTFLEPACGDGNFLAEILTRKLDALENDSDFERKSLIALASLYGIDILPDNVEDCRKKLLRIWREHGNFSEEAEEVANEIVTANIVQGDTLNPSEIIFTEWTHDKSFIIGIREFFNLGDMIKENTYKSSQKEDRQIGIPYTNE